MIKIIFVAIVFTKTLIAQSDTLNKFNANKKRHGYWIKYFDLKLMPTDSINAYYYGYNLYDNGYPIIYLSNHKHFKKCRQTYDRSLPQKGVPTLFEGTFKWYDKKTNSIRLIETYKNGYPIKSEFYSKKNKSDTTMYISEVFDFDKKYENDFYSGYYAFYNNKGEIIKEYYLRKKDNKWGFYNK